MSARPCPGCESLRRQCSELAGELGAAKAGNAGYRERLREAHDGLDRWPRCPDGCGCRLGTEDADARECACAGPCCTQCRENGYPDAPSYRDTAIAELAQAQDVVLAERDAARAWLTVVRAVIRRYEDEELNAVTAFGEIEELLARDDGADSA